MWLAERGYSPTDWGVLRPLIYRRPTPTTYCWWEHGRKEKNLDFFLSVASSPSSMGNMKIIIYFRASIKCQHFLVCVTHPAVRYLLPWLWTIFVNVAVACVRWSQKCFGDGLIYMLCCIASSMKLTEHHKRSSVSPTTARYDSNKFV